MKHTWTTPWYPANIKPVRKGWYETRHPVYGFGFTYWSGDSLFPWSRHGLCCNKKFHDRVEWRGLTKETK